MQQSEKSSRDLRQEQCVKAWLKSKGRGCFVQPTGTGKTITALKAINTILSKYPQMRFIVVVPTDNLKDQWKKQIDEWGFSLNGESVVVNTAIKNNYATDILIIDEAHRVNASTFRDIFKTIKYKYILGLTATYERLDNLHKEVMEKYCPVVDTITVQEALANGWISQYTEYQVLLDVDDIEEYQQYNREFVKSFEFFSFDWNKVMKCVGKNGYIERARLRDEMCPHGTEEQRKQTFKNITYHATNFMRAMQKRKAFINNHPKKIEVARRIINALPFSKIITFSNNIKMAEAIGIGEVYTGKDSKTKARTNLDNFNLQTSGCLNSCKKLIEGADIQGLDTAIMLGIDSSETRATQARGRAIRFKEGKHALIFNLIINNTVELEWMKKSHQKSSYITIDEEGLNAVLEGKEPKPYSKKVKNFQFRF